MALILILYVLLDEHTAESFKRFLATLLFLLQMVECQTERILEESSLLGAYSFTFSRFVEPLGKRFCTFVISFRSFV